MLIEDIGEEIQRILRVWMHLKQTKAAQEGESLDALRAMTHEDLARLAYDNLTAMEHIEKYHRYTMSFVESHCEPSAFPEGGWIVSQADHNGGFNKLCKSLGHMEGYEVFPFWEDAVMYLEKMVAEPERRKAFRIYPVVLVIGGEPRTTLPWRHSKTPH